MSESYRLIEVTPLSGALGAEIEGVDLAEPLAHDVFDEIRRAFVEFHVIFFRDQELTPEQHKDFGRRFGTLNVHPYVQGMRDHPEIIEIIKEPNDTLNFGGGWHSDMSFLEKPALGSMLHALEVPAVGGDTLFANQHLAYERLSDAMKELLDGRKAVHTASGEYSPKGHSAQERGSMSVSTASDAPSYLHPVVRTHPDSKKKALYVNTAFTRTLEGMTRRESKPLLDFLCAHSTNEEFTCRFRWSKGALAFWDNRSVQHYALNDYRGQRRHMRRVTINGDKPY